MVETLWKNVISFLDQVIKMKPLSNKPPNSKLVKVGKPHTKHIGLWWDREFKEYESPIFKKYSKRHNIITSKVVNLSAFMVFAVLAVFVYSIPHTLHAISHYIMHAFCIQVSAHCISVSI